MSVSNTKVPSWGAEEDPATANPGVLGGDTGSSLLARGVFEEERKTWGLLAVSPASSGKAPCEVLRPLLHLTLSAQDGIK